MICENCGQVHDGSYGSGRFCCQVCARSFSTKCNRQEINKRISDTLLAKQIKRAKKDKKQERDQILNDLLNAGFKYLEYPNLNLSNRYLIDSNGIVISCTTLKPLKFAYSTDSYKRIVVVDNDKKQHMLYVHRCVAYNYLPNPSNLPVINHKDENPSNNAIDNLEWCTVRYNTMYSKH